MFIAAIFGSIVILMNDSDIQYAVLLLPPAIFAAINFLHSYHQADYKAPPYELFFSALWNNICVIIVAIVFLLVTNLFLLAWAELFYTLGIPQLLRALSNSYFTWLINPVIYFLGLYIAFRWEKILNSLRMIIFNFFAVLLPITMVFGWTMF
jgi:hypothetical protein